MSSMNNRTTTFMGNSCVENSQENSNSNSTVRMKQICNNNSSSSVSGSCNSSTRSFCSISLIKQSLDMSNEKRIEKERIGTEERRSEEERPITIKKLITPIILPDDGTGTVTASAAVTTTTQKITRSVTTIPENEHDSHELSETQTITVLQPKMNIICDVNIPSRETFCGLINLGNTCYANSCLQILYNLRRVRKNFLEKKNRGFFHELVRNLFENMILNKSNSPVKFGRFEPSNFMKEFRRKRIEFVQDEQHDAQEFMTVLLEILHQEINKIDTDKSQMKEFKNQTEAWNGYVRYIDNSYLSKNFLGQAESIVTCQICQNKSLSWFCFWQMTLHISPTTETLVDCFKEFRDVEKLEKDSAPTCIKCKQRQPATKTQYICRAPHYLFCHLKRFTYDGQKIYSKIEIPDELIISTKQYVFQGAILHSGFMQAGHYTTLISIPDGLFLHDDEDIIQMTEKTESYFRRKLDYDAYMVFYRSVGTISSKSLSL